MMGITNAFTPDFGSLAEALRERTVQVRIRGHGTGSGVIWRADGLIVTNAHVARGLRAQVVLADKRVFDAVVTKRDPRRDLAALAVEANDLPAVEIGNSDQLRVGELILAIGNPFGHIGALSVGIVHAIRQKGWVEADVRLAPGNSGGPLANAGGQVVGINSMIAGGLALAVPSNEVERFLRRDEESRTFLLGVTVYPVMVPQAENNLQSVFGLLVFEVKPGSLAEKSGLLMGDVLTGIGGRGFNTPDDLSDALREAGEEFTIDVIRGGKKIICEVTTKTDVMQEAA